MSQRVLDRLKEQLAARILETVSFRGDEVAIVAPGDWPEVAKFLRDDPELAFDHFIDLTAVDYPEREPEVGRFDLVLMLRSSTKAHRIRLKTRVKDGEEVESLVPLWAGANWQEREVWDMFGIRFRGHPDLRRILLYDQFVGHPLRKDYPIERTQPIIPYRDVDGIDKIAPFGPDEGEPWGRIDWQARLAGRERHVSPAVAVQTGEKRALSEGTENEKPELTEER